MVISSKGVGFCVIKKHTFEEKLTQVLESEQFEIHDNMNDSVVQKMKKNSNKELLAINKRDEITDGYYARLRSAGGQPA